MEKISWFMHKMIQSLLDRKRFQSYDERKREGQHVQQHWSACGYGDGCQPRAGKELTILSCGHYRLLRLEKLHTVRIQGRRDWQLLYVAKGAGHFFRPREERVKQGSVVVYPPGEPQDYFYLLKEAPEIYWIHFTGERAEGLLEEWGLFHGHSCFVGEQDRYLRCFEEIIQELQLQPPGFQRLCALRFEELLLSMGRQRLRLKNPQLAGDSLVTQVLNDMYKTYYRNYTIEDYAKRHNVSVCWLIRRFKQVTGESPNQYLIQIRIRRARELLESSRLNMGEIASVLGYESPLYFSRQFKQLQGVSPKRYREQRQK